MQIMKLLIMQLSTSSCHLLPVGCKYSPQYLFSNDLSVCSSGLDTKFHTHIQTKRDTTTDISVSVLCCVLKYFQHSRAINSIAC
jgi:hypothetical protein